MNRHLPGTSSALGGCCVAIPVLVCLLSGFAHGQMTYEWKGTASSEFTNPANWNPATVAPVDAATPANARLSVHNGANNPLIYTTAQGHTIYDSAGRALFIGSNADGAMTITGGIFESRAVSEDGMANGNHTASLTLDGGDYLNNAGKKTFLVVYDSVDSQGTLTINNGNFTAYYLHYGFGAAATGTGIVNLNGGTLSTARVADLSTNTVNPLISRFNFNGGLLKAINPIPNPTFLEGLDDVRVQAGGAKIDTNGHSITIAQNLLGDPGSVGGGLTKLGSGTLILNGANTFTGATQLDAGLLQMASATALGTADGGTTVANGAWLELTGSINVAGESITIRGFGDGTGALQSESGDNTWGGTVTFASGDTRVGAENGATLRISGAIQASQPTDIIRVRNKGGTTVFSGTPKTYTVNTQVMSDTLQIDGGANILPTGSTLILGTSLNAALRGTFDLNGFDQRIAGLQTQGDAAGQTVTNSSPTVATLTVQASGTSAYTGALTENLALTKSGSGTLTLGGTKTLTGNVRVLDGTLALAHTSHNNLDRVPVLRLDAAAAVLDVTGLATGRLDLVAGQRLQGLGTVRGDLTVVDGASLAPGNSPGHLAIDGDYRQLGLLELELAGNTQGVDYDWLGVTGAAVLGGQLELTLLNGFTPNAGDAFQVLTAASVTANGLTLAGELGSTWNYRVVAWAGGEALEVYAVTAVPEPSTLALLSLVAIGYGWARIVARRDSVAVSLER